ncbi:MAG: hypothetical protein H7336_11525 [Bacteriovorax sp.]|nr:hypothetical protein [Bacteriovorax sp.]
MKYLLAVCAATLAFSAMSATCPNLEGHYPKCHSEIRDIKGEYNIEQYMKDETTFYQIHYTDDDSNDDRTDAIRTDGVMESRKEKLPRVGIKVRIDSKSRCNTDSVVSDADVYFLGKKVGTFTTKIYKDEKNTLYSNLDGSYLGKPLSKRIVCTQE